ncbi:MAG TPA: ATP-binding cassette domain-containing protein [Pseudomonadales bacterium]|nr:ATP-binding cassette domain-containing protein [Pseudomonadales bacterium]
MSLLALQDLKLDFGGPPLLDGASFTIERGERVCLLGRNGTGKSSLLAMIMGRVTPDGGEIRTDAGMRVADLPQDIPVGRSRRVGAVVAEGLGELGALLDEHARLVAEGDGADMRALANVGTRIDEEGGWDLQARVDRTLTRLDLDPDAPFDSLSGGSRRRVLLGRALVSEPDLLLLDEPTNHLDVETIEWLEGVLSGFQGAVLFTSHDRRFVQRVATRIVELDRGQLMSYPGNWDQYERQRDARLEAEAGAAAEFDRRLAEEEVWIRQGIKARRTRNEGRVRRLESMRVERRERRELSGAARMSVQQAERSGQRVVEAEDVNFAFAADVAPVIRDFGTLVERGDRIGILGRNGAGKTTLLNLLLGDLAPTTGRVRRGTRIELALFDQHRSALDEAAKRQTRVQDFVADGDEFVDLDGGRRHVIGYLQDFLFPPERARGPVSVLSGGERARLQLARLFAKPSNLLVMDEPTNDLDMETLELLEERLLEYPGTVLLVSHDREFLDRVVTSTLVLEGDGLVGEYVGGFSDWQRQRPATPAPRGDTQRHTAPPAKPPAVEAAPTPPPARARRKLGFKEQRELDALPAQIEALETRMAELQKQLADPELYRGPSDKVVELNDALQATEAEHASAFERWTELDG